MSKITDRINAIQKAIGLVSYAEAHGWEKDKVKSSPSVTVLRAGSEKIMITKGQRCQHEIFTNRDRSNRGDIVDFACWVHGWTIKEALDELGGKDVTTFPSGKSVTSTSEDSTASDEPDRKKCAKVWSEATWNPEPDYLLSRGLSSEVLNDDRFKDTFRTNSKGVVMFLHRDRQGMTGYELRGIDAKTGEKLKGFMRDGKRSLWYSNNLRSSGSIVICESAINALSHYQIFGWDCAYVSFGGAISLKQKELLTGLFAKVAARYGQIIVGTDNDQAGSDYFTTMKALTETKLARHTPIDNDWNSDLTFVD